MALAGHVAADGDEGPGAEGELLGAQQRGDQQVVAGLEAAVGAQRDAVAQVVAEQRPGGPRTGRAPTARPTCLMDDSGDAPVPPAWPDRWM